MTDRKTEPSENLELHCERGGTQYAVSFRNLDEARWLRDQLTQWIADQPQPPQGADSHT